MGYVPETIMEEARKKIKESELFARKELLRQQVKAAKAAEAERELAPLREKNGHMDINNLKIGIQEAATRLQQLKSKNEQEVVNFLLQIYGML